MNNKHILEGKTILEIKIADDKEAIKFITTEGDIVARCDADCCSHTWIESVELPNSFPAIVISAEDVAMPDLGDIEGCDVVAYYGFKIVTDKGEIIIDYRNESNGYYGGNLSWPDDSYFYGGVYGQNVSKENWVEVKE